MFKARTIKILSFFLAVNILSHILYFHYELESVTLCVKNGNYHIENASAYEKCHESRTADIITVHTTYSGHQSCEDYSVDDHAEVDIVKKAAFNFALPISHIGAIANTETPTFAIQKNTNSLPNIVLSEYKTISLLI